NELVPMLRRLVGAGTALHVHATPSFVAADRMQLDQVLLNLVINARDATAGSGSISIRCRELQLEHPRDAVQGDRVTPGRYTVLSVQDTGAGIPMDLQKRVFEPFFTTKATGEGTGLGLSMVYGLVRQSGGFVSLDSTPGQGTSIEILLPAHAAPASAATATATATAVIAPAAVMAVPAANRTVLVVDDEDSVRRLVSAVLRRHGFSIIEAANGREALTALAERYDVDLVISDVLMPELGGRELAKQLQRDRPEMPVLFISGYTNQELANEGGSLDADATFLAKPFSSTQLMGAVSTLLH
ncbi:MAG: ATP-binding protein, partial [Gemmatimonadota bacterium]|nr:ATP-binding protein [Gemmatimonadota bacterium]